MLSGGGESGQGNFGSSVALSGDGNTALIGGFADNNFVGAAWAFTRSASTWTQEGPKLTASDESGAGGFGGSVALSGDGRTALIGGQRRRHSGRGVDLHGGRDVHSARTEARSHRCERARR